MRLLIFSQGERYSAWGGPDAEPLLFTERDLERHTVKRKQVSQLYSTGALVNMEEPLDEVVEALFERLNALRRRARWLKYLIGYITSPLIPLAFSLWVNLLCELQQGRIDANVQFGKTFGFLRTGQDIDALIETIHRYSRYGANIGVFVEWHGLIFRLMQRLAPSGDVGMAYLSKFTSRTITAQLGEKENEYEEGERDMLRSLLAKHQKEPDAFTLEDIHHHTVQIVVAGAETTGITLSAAIYFLWTNPRSLLKLRHELDSKGSAGRFNDIVTVKDTIDCPYLQAVIKETIRLHPGIGLGLTRIVPEGGLTLSGRYFPEGVCLHISNCSTREKRD